MAKTKKNEATITIVSGLPRSGTSLMMQMLKAGGMPIVTDNIRKADDDNPRGYYEFEMVKTIKDDTSWLPACKGKAVKMVSDLLYHLPDEHIYKVIFMKREMKEILASQGLMLQRLGKGGSALDDEKMAAQFETHMERVEQWLSTEPHISVLYVHYNAIMNNPLTAVQLVNQFLDGWLHKEPMAQVVERSLYRQRRESIVQENSSADNEEKEVKKQLEDLGYL